VSNQAKEKNDKKKIAFHVDLTSGFINMFMCAKEYNSNVNVIAIYGIIRQLPNRINYVIMFTDGNKLPRGVRNMASC
jgi:hypothetical protein